MTDQEINAAIAEACGWTRWKSSPESKVVVLRKPNTEQRKYWLGCGSFTTEEPVTIAPGIPDYANDLNAMHEAEKTLFGIQCENYARLLTGAGLLFYPVAHATARQRAEAFLRALGKWREAATPATPVPGPALTVGELVDGD